MASQLASSNLPLAEQLERFWADQMEQVQVLCSTNKDFKNHNDLPLARIKRIMKSDEGMYIIFLTFFLPPFFLILFLVCSKIFSPSTTFCSIHSLSFSNRCSNDSCRSTCPVCQGMRAIHFGVDTSFIMF